MKCLVVTTHPLSNSLCKLLTDNVVNTLVSMNHDVILEDLYADKFDPVLTPGERQSYYGGSFDASGVADEARRLQDADALVLLFPTWWFSFPAMLKGWFDRVWAPGIAYDHASDFGPITPRLDKLKNVLVVTTLGAPWWVDKLIMWQPVKRVIKIALLQACTKNSSLTYLSLYNSEKLTRQRIKIFRNKIEKALNDWKN
ncbi:MAG: NAD(P)H-dependent oxidoreductase [Desulfobacterales bacterium]|nr:NAD(P)H-dependent oxidoreductase [Desulfobacterales bacterium]